MRAAVWSSAVVTLLAWGLFLSPSPSATEVADAARTAPAGAVAPDAKEAIAEDSAVAGWRVAPSPAPSVATLAAADAATLNEHVALRQLAHDVDLPLSEAQWVTFAAVAAHYQAVRQAYEASIATVSDSATGGYRVAVPSYPEAGDALRDYFYAELAARLGAESSAAIEHTLGQALDGYFAGFGVGVQTLDFPSEALAQQPEALVTRTATYWNSHQGDETLATRRQAHFPWIEDPTGHQWRPYFALLAAHVGSRGSPGSS